MANEENKTARMESRNKKKPIGFFGKIAKWFRELRSELKKVVWPTKSQVINNTLVALGVIFASAVVIWAFDQIASRGVQLFISIFH